MDYGHWNFPHEFNPDDWFGFIYRIIEINTGKEYIGKKQFLHYKKKTIRGRKNKKTVATESTWKKYTGSSKELNSQININGIQNYKFNIESLHKTRGSLYYAEVKQQILEDVLRAKLPGTDIKKYYNKVISGVKFIPPEDTTEELSMKIANLLTNNNFSLLTISNLDENQIIEYIDAWISYYQTGKFNQMYGKESIQKGKTYEELYGIEKAKEIKEKLSKLPHKSGKDHPMFGKKRPEEFRKRMSEVNKGRNVGEKNAMYGKPCYYKMTEEEKENWKKKLSLAGKGRKWSDETRQKMAALKGKKKMSTVTCPHCNKIGGRGNMMRYHFDHCKFKID